MTDTVRIPKVFYHDHDERDLPSPVVIGKKSGGYLVAANDPNLGELLSDAEFYADPYGPSEISLGLKSSARATAKAIRKALAE